MTRRIKEEVREARKSIREDIPRLKRFHIEERPAPNSFIQHTAERIAGAKLKKKPIVYVWRPVGKVKPIQRRGAWMGSLNAFDIEDRNPSTLRNPRTGINEKDYSGVRNFVVMPESTYNNPATRAHTYAHELVEYIRHQESDSYTEAHERAKKVEVPIARKYGTTNRQMTYQMRKDFNEAYASEESEKELQRNVSAFERAIKRKQYF